MKNEYCPLRKENLVKKCPRRKAHFYDINNETGIAHETHFDDWPIQIVPYALGFTITRTCFVCELLMVTCSQLACVQDPLTFMPGTSVLPMYKRLSQDTIQAELHDCRNTHPLERG